MTTLANATTFSDNSVFAQVGKQVGTKQSPSSRAGWASARRSRRNLAIALGGLRQGVTPLDMAHAYETFASGGKLVYGTLSPGQSDEGAAGPGPVGIERIDRDRGDKTKPSSSTASG